MVFLAAILLLPAAGCTRGHYRRQADREVYGLVDCGKNDPRWPLGDYTIEPSPDSRFFDPDNPDHLPMPPDDPMSNKLMQRVDGKFGWPFWHRHGDTPFVENPKWRACLPYGEDGGIVLDRLAALRMALVNSPDYQQELENLYLSALDVTFQRFRLDAQFFGGNSTFFTADGPARPGNPTPFGQSVLDVENTLQRRQFLATGGTLVTDVANSLVWQFAGPEEYRATTLLDFTLVQPLLRAGGRAVALEALTESERVLLENIRQMEYFRRAFYLETIAGRTPGPGPTRGGVSTADMAPLPNASTSGILSLLGEQIRIRNQRFNVAQLRKSLPQLQENFVAGRFDFLQVEITRQALYNAERTLLAQETGYQDRLDAYKISLGMPPDLPVRLADPLLDPFNLLDPKLTETASAVDGLLERVREEKIDVASDKYLAEEASVRRQCLAVVEMARRDMKLLDEAVPTRLADLELLKSRPEVLNLEVDPKTVDGEELKKRVQDLHVEFDTVEQQLSETLDALDAMRDDKDQPAPNADEPEETPQDRVRARLEDLADLLIALSLVQAGARLDAVTLVQVDLDPAEALQTARQCRLDWMNARANLVDQWRQIQVTANALRSDLNLTFSGDMTTLDNNPVRFRATTGRLRVGVQFDPPLTRLAERNTYRESLIEYQQARRTYYTFEDRVSQILRGELRSLRQSQLDFELRRAGIRVAITQVDIMRLRVQAPPKGDVKAGEQPSYASTVARDLVNAYGGLLTALNDFLNAWIDYEVDRMNLDLDMGTMQLDQCGAWIDPGPIKAEKSESPAMPDPPEEIPPPEGIPMLIPE